MLILYKLLDWYTTKRRTGYSTVLLDLIKENENIRILCPDRYSASRFGNRGIILDDLRDGVEWIVLPDNHMLLSTFKDLADMMEKITRENIEMKEKLEAIRKIIV